jgi:hypothetical protein
LVNSRTAEPSRATTPARRDSTARARFTLAASVALAVGACWFLSNGFQPGERPGQGTNGPKDTILNNGGASGTDHLPLKNMEADRAKGNNGGIKIDLGKEE